MKQYINTLLYGDSKTKALLWSMIGMVALALVLTVIAIMSSNWSLIILAVLLIFVAVMLGQQYDFSEYSAEDMEEAEDTSVAPEDILIRYTEKKMKQVFIKFKVKQDHRTIMIDRCFKHKIKEAPAYIWVQHGKVHILLIEKEARELIFPATSFLEVVYERAVPVNFKGEYIQMRKPSLVSQVFSEYMPEVYEYGSGGIRKQYKNLYRIGEEIAVTNRSVHHIFGLLGSNFVIRDKITESDEYSEQFKEMYHAYTLFRDHVIDSEEYKNRITRILDNMAYSNMLDMELRINLDKMKQYKFISDDFYHYCLEKRVKMFNDQRKEEGLRTSKKSKKS